MAKSRKSSIKMKKHIRVIALFVILLFQTVKIAAQVDPTLSSMILLYTDKAKSELKWQKRVMEMETTGHIWLKEEWDGTTKIQKRYNAYLDEFRSIIVYASEIYGFYHEISRMTQSMGELTDQLSAHPDNALAVALSSNRNTIYRELIQTSVDIVNDIRMVCLSDIKMTEKERVEIVFAIRPKLRAMNNKLRRLTRAVKYTTLGDVWREIEDAAYKPKSKKEIAQRCLNRWKRQYGIQ